MARYRVLIGMHQQDDHDAPAPEAGQSRPTRTYVAGEEFDTGVDMLKFNRPGMSPKYELVSGHPPARQPGTPIRSPGPNAPPTHDATTPGAVQLPDQPQQRIAPGAVEEQTGADQQQGDAPQGQAQPTQQGEKPLSKHEYHMMLDKMTVEELRQHAAEEEVDLKGATTKSQILRVLKYEHGQ